MLYVLCTTGQFVQILLCFRGIADDTPGTSFFLAPPTLRTTPEWYGKIQLQVTMLVYKHLKELQPRLVPLPAFLMDPTGLDSDGVHFSATTGFDYVIHLIDKSRCVSFFTYYATLST